MSKYILPEGLTMEFGYSVAYEAGERRARASELLSIAEQNNIKAYFQPTDEGVRCDYASYGEREKFAKALVARLLTATQNMTIESEPLTASIQ